MSTRPAEQPLTTRTPSPGRAEKACAGLAELERQLSSLFTGKLGVRGPVTPE
ncbi:hypothetical protein ACFQ7O_18345 [Streptomyces sp. NPDC056485]|uniref:hypothetical protein n=1 Tax=Streptomyces sp. NPDC056485 TaxID=3345834 RepID=UPI0036B21573